MTVQQKARELVDIGRREVVLDGERLEQNRARVLSRATAAAILAASASATSSVSAASTVGAVGKAAGGALVGAKVGTSLSLAKLIMGVAVLGGSVAGTYFLGTRGDSARVPTPLSAPPVIQSAPPLVPRMEVDSTAPTIEGQQTPAEASPTIRSAAPKQRPPATSIRVHAELLRDARSALAAGDAAGALQLLDGQREVAQGPLGPEWTAARILVLCRLGRVAEARQSGARFLKRHGSSPLAAQVASSCARSE